MNMHGIWLTGMAVAATVAMSAGAAEAVATDKTAPIAIKATLTDELVASMRALLLAVTPEISVPAIEIRLPTLRGEQR